MEGESSLPNGNEFLIIKHEDEFSMLKTITHFLAEDVHFLSWASS